MKKTIILFGIALMNMAMVSCSADSVFGEVDLQAENISANGSGMGNNGGNNGGGNGGGNGTGSTNPPPPPPLIP